MTTLDLFIVLFIVLLGLTLISIPLMFLLKGKITKRVLFYIICVIALYVAYGGIRIGIVGSFDLQLVLGLFVAVTVIASFILERVFRKNNKVFFIMQIVAASSLFIGILNAFII